MSTSLEAGAILRSHRWCQRPRWCRGLFGNLGVGKQQQPGGWHYLTLSLMAPASSLVPWFIWKSGGRKAATAWRLALSYALIDGASVLAGAVVDLEI
ncbi:hypothetical protein A4G20_09000 [Pasteurellaceae bacterium RH1A]|nr:hypothetical protein A4G20_09000 [Pasteurellaceae bacterium RH1A]